MATRLTASELAREWRKETIEFDDAIIQHLEGNLGLVPDPALVLGIGMAISWNNMGLSDVVLDLPGCRPTTSGEIVAQFGVEPFLESTT